MFLLFSGMLNSKNCRSFDAGSDFERRGAGRFIQVLMVLALGLSIQSQARAFCFTEAAQRYEVNETILRAIAQHESRLNAALVLTNTNGSIDVGLMGINSVHLSPGEPLQKSGMALHNLLEPCLNVMTGAYLLKLKINRMGNTWDAVGAYHSVTPVPNAKYQWAIWRAVQKLQIAQNVQ